MELLFGPQVRGCPPNRPIAKAVSSHPEWFAPRVLALDPHTVLVVLDAVHDDDALLRQAGSRTGQARLGATAASPEAKGEVLGRRGGESRQTSAAEGFFHAY